MKIANNQGRWDRLPSLQDLGEEELNTLYKFAAIKRVGTNEVLIREGDTDQKFYVILDGEVRIVKNLMGQEEVLATLPRDSWIGEIAFTRKIPRTASAVANRPSLVMEIEESTLGALDEKTQLYFFKRLNDLAFERISGLVAKQKALSNRNKKLVENMFSVRAQEKVDYTRSDLIRGIIKKIPRLPVFAGTLAVKLLQDNISTKEVAEHVKQDPSLVAVVLKTVNAPYYGFQKKITDINHAVVLIGFNELHQLVVGEGIRRTMPNSPFFKDLHAHSVAISHIAFALSNESGTGKPVQVSTLALLHDLGEGVIQLLKEQNPNLGVLIEGLDLAKMGALLLKSWNLPDIVWQGVAYQRYPEFSPPSRIPKDIQVPVTLLYLAHLCYRITQGEKEEELLDPFLDEYKKLLGWDHHSLEEIVQRILLPSLAKKLASFPAFLRKLVKEQMEKGKPK